MTMNSRNDISVENQWNFVFDVSSRLCLHAIYLSVCLSEVIADNAMFYTNYHPFPYIHDFRVYSNLYRSTVREGVKKGNYQICAH